MDPATLSIVAAAGAVVACTAATFFMAFGRRWERTHQLLLLGALWCLTGSLAAGMLLPPTGALLTSVVLTAVGLTLAIVALAIHSRTSRGVGQD